MRDAYDLLIIGGGMAAGKLAAQLHERNYRGRVMLIGAEQSIGYNRVLLPKYISDQCAYSELIEPNDHWQACPEFTVRTGVRVKSIDLDSRQAELDTGATLAFREVVFATGSKVPKPDIQGIDSPIVTELRCLADAYRMKALARTAEWAIVVGGGLLGLEAADALSELGLRVRVVHRGPRLMSRQLDDTCANWLRQDLEEQGIAVSLNTTVSEIHTTEYLQCGEVRLSDQSICAADLVVFATGAVPDDEIARAAGIECNAGVVTDLCLRTSHAGVYALGECANVAGMRHQLVEPVFAQAEALAQTLCGAITEVAAPASNTRLKMRHTALFTAGEIPAANCDDIAVQDPKNGIYRRLFFNGSILSGALLFGDTTASREITACIGQPVTPELRENLTFGTN